MVKNPPAKQETWVRSLDWKDPMEEGMATRSSILAWRLLMAGYSPWCKESDTTEQPTTAQRRRMSRLPGSSAGKESACNAGDPDSIPGSGRSPEKGIGYPLQYSWASLVAQTVKNPPAM